MKKLLATLLAFSLMAFLTGCICDEVSLFYSESGEKDGFSIEVNKVSRCCFVGAYNCAEYSENMELTIPDEYEGNPIKRIGGYFGRGVPTPFMISVDEVYMNAPEGSEYYWIFRGDIEAFGIEDKYVVEEIPFILNIGKNIEVIEYVEMDSYFPHINEDGSITMYHPVVSINCSEENKNFYSKDGKLYNKKTDELITAFEYAD